MMTVHHVGYLVKNIEKAQKAFFALGYAEKSALVYDGIRDADIVFLEKDGYVVELVSPKSQQSVVANLIKTYKNAPYHICYETDELESDLARLEQAGFMRIDEPTPAPAIDGRKVMFLLSASAGMIELLGR